MMQVLLQDCLLMVMFNTMSGNGGYFSMVGIRLLLWYQEPKNVEYLFSLGQTSLIGKIGK